MKSKKRILSILLTLALTLGLLALAPITAHAATGMATINVNTLGAVNDDNSAAAATESQWYYDGTTNVLTLNTISGNYTLSGSNGNLWVRPWQPSQNITLNGANITAPTGFVGFGSYYSCTITLVGSNTLTAVNNNTLQVNPGIIYTFTGGGSLTATGGAGNPAIFFSSLTSGEVRVTGNAAVTAVGTGEIGIVGSGSNSILIGDNAKLTIKNNNAGTEVHTFAKADTAVTHQWKLTSCTTGNPLTGSSITVTIPAGGTGTIEREPIHVHSYGAAWVSDATNHWKECACGDKTSLAAHTPGAAATCTAAQTCTVCGFQIAPAAGHSYAAAWSFDAAGHWKACACGDKGSPGPHTPGDWEVVTPATAAPGLKHKVCTVCGYETATEVIPELRFVGLFGLNTRYVSDFWNWFKFIVLFGWIWMAFVI